MVENLAHYFADYGVNGTLAGQPVRVLYDAATGVDVSVAAPVPQVQISTASVPASVHGASLVIPQGTFKVREREDDGSGLTLLQLSRV